jgi:hypothetical protein
MAATALSRSMTVTGKPQHTAVVADQDNRVRGFLGNRYPRALVAPDGNEGVGEHVRTRFHFEL